MREMKKLRFSYEMKLKFDTPVQKHRFTIRCVPQSNDRQEIRDLQVAVYPREFLSEDQDSFGNLCIYGYSEHAHDHFSIAVSGTAKTGLADRESEELQLIKTSGLAYIEKIIIAMCKGGHKNGTGRN